MGSKEWREDKARKELADAVDELGRYVEMDGDRFARGCWVSVRVGPRGRREVGVVQYHVGDEVRVRLARGRDWFVVASASDVRVDNEYRRGLELAVAQLTAEFAGMDSAAAAE